MSRPHYKPDPAHLAGLTLTGPAAGDPDVGLAMIGLNCSVAAIGDAKRAADEWMASLIRALLAAHGGNVTATAAALGMPGESGYVVLRRWLVALGVVPPGQKKGIPRATAAIEGPDADRLLESLDRTASPEVVASRRERAKRFLERVEGPTKAPKKKRAGRKKALAKSNTVG